MSNVHLGNRCHCRTVRLGRFQESGFVGRNNPEHVFKQTRRHCFNEVNIGEGDIAAFRFGSTSVRFASQNSFPDYSYRRRTDEVTTETRLGGIFGLRLALAKLSLGQYTCYCLAIQLEKLERWTMYFSPPAAPIPRSMAPTSDF